MEQKQPEEIKQTMAEIYTQIAEREGKDTAISNITYYKEFTFDSAKFIENDIFVTKLQKTKGKNQIETFEIYNKDGELIATVNEKGKVQFAPEYIELLKQEYKKFFEILKLDEATLELPERLREEDISLEHDELEKEVEKQEQKGKKIEKKQEEEKSQDDNSQEQEIAKQKGIPTNNVLIVRDNSNLYKDHPEIERNLIFSRDNDGKVKAEYIDENGELQPSKYIQPSNTSVRQETISIGKDGNPVTRETPQQVMRTQNLTKRDQDVRDVRINIKFDQYGYMDIEEARQGRNGEWAAHDIEVRGRDYNSAQVNEETSMKTGMADPDKETSSYESMENVGKPQDEIQYDRVYLMQHADEIIDGFINQGYQKIEAVAIFNHMIGEEALTEKQAKERVNEEIKEVKQEEREEEPEERTPWGDAEARDARR
mgnify:FL=1